MRLQPPRPTRTDTLFPSPTLCPSLRPRRGRVGEPLLDQLVGDQVLVDHHRRDERAQPLAGRVAAELHQPLDALGGVGVEQVRSEEHTSELQSLMRISYAVFCLKKKKI